MKPYFVFDNNKWHLIKTSQTPKYERVISAPTDAEDAKDFDFQEVTITDEFKSKKEWVATFNQSKKNARLQNKEAAENTRKAKEQIIKKAKERLEKVDFDVVGEINDIKQILEDLFIYLKLN